MYIYIYIPNEVFVAFILPSSSKVLNAVNRAIYI